MNVVRIENIFLSKRQSHSNGFNRSNGLPIVKYLKYYFACRRADMLLRQSISSRATPKRDSPLRIAQNLSLRISPALPMECRGSMPVDGDLKRLPRQRATVSNETGSELGQEFRGDSESAFRQR